MSYACGTKVVPNIIVLILNIETLRREKEKQSYEQYEFDRH